jgi:nicotinate-nucleotide adenylyltransferase
VIEKSSLARVGVFGGTFDPVHNGHLHIANVLRDALQIDRVVWVPAGRPPHKRGQIVSADFDRVAMLELAISDAPFDTISTVELDRPGPSYTADTLTAMANELPPASLYFLMGEDSLRDLPNWREPERILAAAELAVVGRPGVDVDLKALYLALPASKDRVHLVPTRELAISSSDIRRRVAAGDSITDLVPPSVAAYIADRELYKPRALSP